MRRSYKRTNCRHCAWSPCHLDTDTHGGHRDRRPSRIDPCLDRIPGTRRNSSKSLRDKILHQCSWNHSSGHSSALECPAGIPPYIAPRGSRALTTLPGSFLSLTKPVEEGLVLCNGLLAGANLDVLNNLASQSERRTWRRRCQGLEETFLWTAYQWE